VAQRLLEHDAHVRSVQSRGAELGADLREQVRAGGEEEDRGVGAARLQPLLQARIVLGLRQVHAAVVHQLGKARELLVARPLGAVHLAEALADEGAVGVVAALVAGHGEDAAALGQLAVPPGLEQGGHQLAPRQVAGTAEENEFEGHPESAPSLVM
jgi:ethanolamine transporter EutH